MPCAGADGLQTHMRHAFGKAQGTVVRIHRSQVTMSILTTMQSKEHVTEAFPRAKFMFPGHQKIRISEKWGLTKVFYFFFFSLQFYLYIFECAWSSLLCGLLSRCGDWASYCSGFSCCRAGALGCTGFSTCRSGAPEHRLDSCGPGPSHSATYGISQDQGLICVSCVGRRTLYYWAIWHWWIWKHSGRKAAHLRWLWGQISTHP